MKYIKHFESVDSSSVEDLLKSYGFYSEEEISEVLESSLLDLKDYIQYFNDYSDEIFIELDSINFNKRFRKSNLKLNDQVLKIYADRYKGNQFEILKKVNKDFKVLETDIIGRVYHYYINLIPENLTYYEIYGYSQGKMKAGDCYRIKPLYPMFKDNYTDSLNYSSELIREFSVKLNHLRVLYDVGFSYDGKVIDIRILPK
jgi:hypothetical protein